MISAKEAYKILQKELPGYTIMAAADYRNKYYLFNAQKDPTKTDYGDPFYVVEKSTGMAYRFSPSEDLHGFLNAINNHEIDIKTLK